ncbi:MAG: PLP-dependent lyase/thiolase, partial [Acholeplasmataceae bacterium]|nr:PLP-dependent lyase/thiolase [Acholeplasmataceae bacterium]
EKARACEAYGAEVIQLTVGPELFYQFLLLLEETGYFNASLYSPYGIMGIETLGYEIATEVYNQEKKFPEMVICTNAGGGNLTGTARGLIKAGATTTKIVAASVDLSGLHMASDLDFNKKSFTTGHTGFGIPFSTFPDRSDVPRSAARPMRYMDSYVLVNQGTVFFITEALALLEGMERGPAGNTSLAAAFSLAQEMKDTDIIVVQETEYTGAGKHMNAQISFAKDRGISLLIGDPLLEKPGKNLIFPKSGSFVKHRELDLDGLRKTYLKHFDQQLLFDKDYEYLALELKTTIKRIKELMEVNNEIKK